MRDDAKRLGFIICCMGILTLAACKDPSFFQALGEKLVTDAIAISPSTVTVPVNGTVTFAATGGSPPYTYSVLPARAGAIDPITGVYTAPTTSGSETVRVTDKKGHMADAVVTITGSTGALAIQPASLSVNVGGSITFVATGGTGPYSFTMQTSGSGAPVGVGLATGVYQAGNSGSTTDVVKVTDAASATKTATITVTATNSPVNYDISTPLPTLPTAGTGGTALGGGYGFTIHNGGTGAGSQPISWWVFLSPNAVPGTGTVLVDSGTYVGPAIGAGSSATVPLSWTWPSMLPPSANRYLYILISAADDLTPANNTYTSAIVPMAPDNVHYTVSGVTNTGGVAAGGSLTGLFTLTNSGTENGNYTVNWKAYVSLDGTQTIDAGAVLVASGSTSKLNAGPVFAVPINFSGTWPAAHGAYFLKVQVSAPDEVNPDPALPAPGPWGNTGVSAASASTTYVDNGVTVNPPAPTGGAGSPIVGGSFTVTNFGNITGGTITWTAYASATTTLGSGATVVSSGSQGGVAVGTPAVVGITGNWPPGTSGTRYLIVQISSADDINTANNINVSAAVAVTAPDVKYRIPAAGVTNTPPSIAGGTINGSFILNNFGTAAGSQTVFWTAYVSTDPTNTIDGSAKVVDSGTHVPVAAGLSPGQSFGGTWPATPGTYYLKVSIVAADDMTAGDDIMASASVTVTRVDYAVTAVTWTGGNTAGAPFTASFTVKNNGNANGTQNLYWSAYVSFNNSTLDSGDSLVASSFIGGGLGAGVPQLVNFGGNWPLATGTYYIIVSVTAADESTSLIADDQGQSLSINVVPPNVDYTVVAGSVTGTMGTVAPATPVSGTFLYHNGGLNNGSQWVSWIVYASPNPTLDSSAISIASGMSPPLGAGLTSAVPISFNGTWPLSYGNYYLLVSLSVQEDVLPGNNTAASAGTTPVGIYTGIVQNGDCIGWTNFTDLTGVVLQPGMKIVVHTASMPASNIDHIFRFNTGTANTFTATWTLDVPMLAPPATNPPDLGLYYYTAPGVFDLNQWLAFAKVNTIGMRVTPDAHNVVRILDLWNGRPKLITSYTLTISAD